MKEIEKFELRKSCCSFTYKERTKIEEGCTYGRDEEPELVHVYEDRYEAFNALNKLTSDVRTCNGNYGLIYEVTEYYVESVILDEDGDLIETVGADFAEMDLSDLTD